MEARSNEVSALALPAHRRAGDRKATVMASSNSSLTGVVAPRAAAGADAGADHHRRARGRVPAVARSLPRGSCKVEASAHGPGEGGDGSGGGAAFLMMARRNRAASRRLMPCFVSCVV
jgi:hypothetical protein